MSVVDSAVSLTNVVGVASNAFDLLQHTMASTSSESKVLGSNLSQLGTNVSNFNKGLYDTARNLQLGAKGIESLRREIETLSKSTVISQRELLELYNKVRLNLQATSLWGSEFGKLSKVLSTEFGKDSEEVFSRLLELGNRLPGVFEVLSGKANLTKNIMSDMAAILDPRQFLEYERLLYRVVDRQNDGLSRSVDKLKLLSDSFENLRKTGSTAFQELGRAAEPFIRGALIAPTSFNNTLSGIFSAIAGSQKGSLSVEQGIGGILGAGVSSFGAYQASQSVLPSILSFLNVRSIKNLDPGDRAAAISPWSRLIAAGVAVPALGSTFGNLSVNSEGSANYGAAGGLGFGSGAIGGAIGMAGFGAPAMAIGAVVFGLIGAFTSLTSAADTAASKLSSIHNSFIQGRVNRGGKPDPELERLEKEAEQLIRKRDSLSSEYGEVQAGPMANWRHYLFTGENIPDRAKRVYREQADNSNAIRQNEIARRARELSTQAKYVKSRLDIEQESQKFSVTSGYQRALQSSMLEGGFTPGQIQVQMGRFQSNQLEQYHMMQEKMKQAGGQQYVESEAARGDRGAQALIQGFYELQSAIKSTSKQIADFGVTTSAAMLEISAGSSSRFLERFSASGGNVYSGIAMQRSLRINTAGSNENIARSALARRVGTSSKLLTSDPESLLQNPSELAAAAAQGGIGFQEAAEYVQKIAVARQERFKAEVDSRKELYTEDSRGLGIAKELAAINIKNLETQGRGFPEILKQKRDNISLLQREIDINNERLKRGFLSLPEQQAIGVQNRALSSAMSEQQKSLRLEELQKTAEYANIYSDALMSAADHSKKIGESLEKQSVYLKASLVGDYERILAIQREMNDPQQDPVRREQLKAELMRLQTGYLEKQRSILIAMPYERNTADLKAQESIGQSILEIQSSQNRPLTEQLPIRRQMLDYSIEEVNQTKQYLENLIASGEDHEKVRSVTVQLASEYAGIAKQVQYIRNSWMDVMSEQGMMLPGGTYTMPMGLSGWQAYGSGNFPFKPYGSRTPYGGGMGSYESTHKGFMESAYGALGGLDIEGTLQRGASYADSNTTALVGGMSGAVSMFSDAVSAFAGLMGGNLPGARSGRTGNDTNQERGMGGWTWNTDEYGRSYRSYKPPLSVPNQRPSRSAPTGGVRGNMGANSDSSGPSISGVATIGPTGESIGTIKVSFDINTFQALVMQTVNSNWS